LALLRRFYSLLTGRALVGDDVSIKPEDGVKEASRVEAHLRRTLAQPSSEDAFLAGLWALCDAGEAARPGESSQAQIERLATLLKAQEESFWR
jgi:hypothetical protein